MRTRTTTTTTKKCLGLQGGLLAHFIPSPLALSSTTVGRKFHRACLERALCCRAQDFEQPTETLAPEPGSKRRRKPGPRLRPPAGYRVQHLAVMSTAVKLDPNTAISTAKDAVHASFDDPRVLWWSAAATAPEMLDGMTGLPLEQQPAASEPAPSAVCSQRLFARFGALCERTRRDALLAASRPADAKHACAAYAQAREALLTDPYQLGPWQVKG
mmetsp:Transcript_6166/g.16111  ORF Transcript_6166/g.16111 Transcript_6166/m.16111 type:complete len:215 (-) Transcript_6166:94-738(-)